MDCLEQGIMIAHVGALQSFMMPILPVLYYILASCEFLWIWYHAQKAVTVSCCLVAFLQWSHDISPDLSSQANAD